MPVTTSQQIAGYYAQFQNVEVTFNKEVTQATNLNTKQVFIKCLGYQWPCIIYSTSLSEAKVIVKTGGSFNESVRKANNLVSLRYCFAKRDKGDPLAFFVAARISGYTPYDKQRKDLSFVTLSYTQRPPDDLIEIIGQLLEAGVNSRKRSEERVTMTADTTARFGLRAKETTIEIAGVPRRCIVRDVSFSGAKVIVLGIARYLVDKPALLHLDLVEPQEKLQIPGTVVRFEPVEGRSDIAAFALRFDDDKVPIAYKMRLSTLLKTIKSKHKSGESNAAAE
ncbi:MAG: PilZ domain-containing protein [Spirochaetaceae bacterium]|nr:MAG: PilZ domain-containing protein [Spirochaetaceae bacterium]